MYFTLVVKTGMCLFVEQDLAESEARLCASTEEQREAKEELETCRSDIQILQGTLTSERERAEALISRSLSDTQQAEVRAISLTPCHKMV